MLTIVQTPWLHSLWVSVFSFCVVFSGQMLYPEFRAVFGELPEKTLCARAVCAKNTKWFLVLVWNVFVCFEFLRHSIFLLFFFTSLRNEHALYERWVYIIISKFPRCGSHIVRVSWLNFNIWAKCGSQWLLSAPELPSITRTSDCGNLSSHDSSPPTASHQS